jgi:peptide/nickel transport system permease protein
MATLVLRRLLRSVPLVLVVSAVTFVLESLVPGDTARAIVGVLGTTAQYEKMRKQLGLDKPLWYQYYHYMVRLLHGDLGSSAFSGESVAHLLAQRLPVTVSLVILTTLFCGIVGASLGMFSAVRGGVVGRLVDGLSVLGMALPNFWLALVLVTLLAVDVHVFPATGYVSPTTSVWHWLVSLVLPVVALGLGPIAIVAKQSRDSMKDVLARDYIRTLRGCGLPRRRVLFKHALRNAAIPTLTVLGLIFVSALSFSVFVEQVFVMPGLGSLAVQATTQHDIPIIEGVTVYFTLIVVAVNLVLDVAYALINPRARETWRRHR